MRQRDNRWITRLLAASCLGTALLCAPQVQAADRVQVAMATPTDDDLSLFWDEKELYVQTATRSEKPITQVAENMTVITARDIEVMNANSVAEVLARVPGLFVDFGTSEFSSAAAYQIQGSDTRHVTVLLDGMPVNVLAGGNADTSFIPVRIVERIEIIKGAASSAWGSGLGGVVNIITRSTGDNAQPNGMLSASLGEAWSRNLAADIAGKNGQVGYFLYAGQQASDGLRNRRDYRRNSFFGKLLLTPNRDLDITIATGYSTPEFSTGDLAAAGIRGKALIRTVFVNSNFEYRATPELAIRGGLHMIQNYSDIPTNFLSDDSLFSQNVYDERTIGANLRGTWTSGVQTLTVGGDIAHGALDETVNSGAYLQGLPAPFKQPATLTVSPKVDRWGLFVNDTFEFGPVAVTPGVRLDHDSVVGSFISPSIGATYELAEHTVLRASAARGFTSPSPADTKGRSLFHVGNPQLKPEYGWSYQAGVESGVADLINLKATVFRNEISKVQIKEFTSFPYSQFVNGKDMTKQGYELEADTVPYYNLSLKLGHAYAHAKADAKTVADRANNYWDTYSWLIGIKYDDRRSFNALLSGSYVFYGLDPSQGYNADKYKTFIWDLTGTKKIQLTDKTNVEAFATVHNIFSGEHSTSTIYPNPNRWVEGGVRFRF